jgi:transcriptional regulator with XRE-family HTH domain
VIRYERGHDRPQADALERIAQVGGVSVDWLLRVAWREASRRQLVQLVRRVLRA